MKFTLATGGKIPFGLLYPTFKFLQKVNMSSWCNLIELSLLKFLIRWSSHCLNYFYCSYSKFLSVLLSAVLLAKKCSPSHFWCYAAWLLWHFSFPPHFITLHFHLPSSLKSGIKSLLTAPSQLKVYIVIIFLPVICEVIFFSMNFLPLTLFDLSLWPPCYLQYLTLNRAWRF